MKTRLGATTSIYPAPVLIICTYKEGGIPNAMVLAWGGMSSTSPPLLAISMDENHQTYRDIVRTDCFTVNIGGKKYIKEIDFFGAVSGEAVNKFDETKLTPQKANLVDAPIIKEFPLALECKVLEIRRAGDCMHILGEIVETVVDDDCLDEEGRPDMIKIKPLALDPVKNEYYEITETARTNISVGGGG